MLILAIIIIAFISPVTQGQVLSLRKQDWGVIANPKHLKLYNPKDSPASLSFSVPNYPESENYLFTNVRGSFAGAVSVTVSLSSSADAVFGYQTESWNTCAFPSHARIYFASPSLNEEFGRWWANPDAYELRAGATQVTMTIPLTPDRWSSVFGRFGNSDDSTKEAFQQALNNVSYFGLTFGGGCFFGHGVYLTQGSAEFNLLDYRIIRPGENK